ncbi:MAG TPA: hypothetical protein PKE49_14415 [Leptospiraceae bacterium]|nr:hypothetical protein [Leptospirales bacterium]HMX57715.1 hypothetical protein [Leptospiraceae bacterium]HNJ03097.1 hypothetical protein [Leptospiraceae bacterium]HNL67063.1 hypothetical protein [Leptospiraceae bacterium]HNN59249.1 hypothetical protein [Leptospiraceae bacterium]
MLEPDRWPTLEFSLTGMSLLSGGECFVSPFPCSFPSSRVNLLEQAELDLCRGRKVDSLNWLVPNGAESFFDFVFEQAQKGLRVRGDSAAPIEAIHSGGKSWAERFPILHVSEHSTIPSRESARPVSRFIYLNPEGEALPFARREAESFCNLFPDARAAFRTLGEGEFNEAMADATHIYYFGHAMMVDGSPAIPARDAWIPLLSRSMGDVSRKTVFLGACLRQAGMTLRIPGGRFIYPITRIADRPNSFLERIAGSSHLLQGFHSACIRDAEEGDIRRFVYRVKGSIWL